MRIKLWEVASKIGKKQYVTDADFTKKSEAQKYARKVKARVGNARVILSREKKMGIPGVPIKKKAGIRRKAAKKTFKAAKKTFKVRRTKQKTMSFKKGGKSCIKSAPMNGLLSKL